MLERFYRVAPNSRNVQIAEPFRSVLNAASPHIPNSHATAQAIVAQAIRDGIPAERFTAPDTCQHVSDPKHPGECLKCLCECPIPEPEGWPEEQRCILCGSFCGGRCEYFFDKGYSAAHEATEGSNAK